MVFDLAHEPKELCLKRIELRGAVWKNGIARVCGVCGDPATHSTVYGRGGRYGWKMTQYTCCAHHSSQKALNDAMRKKR